MQCNRMERVRYPEVSSLEIWDLWVDGAILQEWSYEPDYPVALREALELVWVGEGATRSNGLMPKSVAGFDAVFLTGGGAQGHELRKELAGLPCAVVFGERTVFGGERGGFELLRARGLSGWVKRLFNRPRAATVLETL